MELDRKEKKCSYCTKTFSISSSLLQHKIFVHNLCCGCKKTFPNVRSLFEHQKQCQFPISSTRKIIKCNQCDALFNYFNARRHKQTVHEKMRAFACKKCDMKFFQKEHLSSHLSGSSLAIKPYRCDMCDFKSCTKLPNNQHNHRNASEMSFQCSRCDYKSSHKPHVLEHEQRGKKNAVRVCSKCGYRSCNKSFNHECKTDLMQEKPKEKVYNVLPLPIPGKWIVKLERLDFVEKLLAQ